jgi:hypothetical protein
MRTRVAPVQPAASVSMHIDVVSVHGLSLTTAQTARFRAALEQELSRLASRAEGATTLGSSAQPFVLAPSLQIGQPLEGSDLGHEVGRLVWAALGRAGAVPGELVRE